MKVNHRNVCPYQHGKLEKRLYIKRKKETKQNKLLFEVSKKFSPNFLNIFNFWKQEMEYITKQVCFLKHEIYEMKALSNRV